VTIASLADRDLWYEDSGGAGVPIVCLHPGAGSSLMWEYQIPAMRAAGYRFIAYDRVGSGKSTLHANAEPGVASDDLEALRRHLGFDRFHLVGTAAGGIVAFDYALTFREHLRSLVVANSIGGVQDESYLALGRRLRPMPEFDRMPPEFRELGPSYRAANADGTARWMELEHQSRPPRSLPTPQTNRQRLTFALLETIKVPTLVMTGDADLYCPPAVLRLFAAHLPTAETRIVPETGHSAYWEQPDEFNRAILAFVAKH
jgi:pimeloyl-ACP methyl ester carboxylesterase